MHILKAGILYFVIIFAAGFALGTIRVLLAMPRFCVRLAELMELPIMMLVSLLAARWVVRGFALPAEPGNRIAMGFVALAFLLLAELTLVLFLQGMTIREYVSSRDPVSG